jgi:agmatine deiminase
MSQWLMPAEWAEQERVWMAFPRDGYTVGDEPNSRMAAYESWARVVNSILEFEPVNVVVDPSAMVLARQLLDPRAEIIEAELDDSWMRDIGPTFVLGAGGELGAVDWTFNGWGANAWALWERDREIAKFVSDEVSSTHIPSTLVNEGGGIHVDGEGTVLVTETVQLDPFRNPYITKERVEWELARTIGAKKTIWLPRGLHRDYGTPGTRGHVDMVACFAKPGVVLLHWQENPEHPDHALNIELEKILLSETDAAGRKLQVVRVPAPKTLKDEHGWVDFTYINHLVVNGGIIACGFGEEVADARAAKILGEAYGRKVVTIDAREIFIRGGGLHCITQQQPKSGK